MQLPALRAKMSPFFVTVNLSPHLSVNWYANDAEVVQSREIAHFLSGLERALTPSSRTRWLRVVRMYEFVGEAVIDGAGPVPGGMPNENQLASWPV
jgi:hypothetical protein